MTTGITLKILEWYNNEKNILSDRLWKLWCSNDDKKTSHDIQSRLDKIDKQIALFAANTPIN